MNEMLASTQPLEELLSLRRSRTAHALAKVDRFFRNDPGRAADKLVDKTRLRITIAGRPQPMDPELQQMIGQSSREEAGRKLSFDERVERMYKKIYTNAHRHRANFKKIVANYDLDSKVLNFLTQREMRDLKQLARDTSHSMNLQPLPEDQEVPAGVSEEKTPA